MRVCRGRLALCALLLAAPVLVSTAAFGQASYTAQVRGVVRDQSGAMITNATITITNDATGIAATTHSDDHGLYILTGLRPAVYTIKSDATGFRSAEQKNVVLQVDQQTSIDFVLHPLGVITTVEVTEAAPLLDTESAAMSTDVTNEYVRDIPLYNRSMFGLVFLAGGVTETTGSGINDNYPSGTNFVSNGQRNATAEISLDGAPLSAPEQGEGGNSNVYYQPSVEIVQEFKVQNNSFSAEYGNNGGTIVNMVLKQGSNAFHGTGWWYGQRSTFDARDYFNSGPKPDHLRDQYGFALGGPIVHNKTFFFVDFEKSRQQDPINIEGVVPTDAERTGDFSQSQSQISNPGGIFDPSTCVFVNAGDQTCTRTRFFDPVSATQDKIPTTEIDPVGQAILNLYPHANIPNASFPDPNFRTVVVTSDPGWQFDVKVDHQINSKNRIGGRYSRHHDIFTAPNVIGSGDFGDGSIYTTNVQNGGLEYNWSVTPTMLWTGRLSVDRVVAPGQTNNYPTLSDVGLPAILAENGLTRIPSIGVDSGFLSIYTQCCVDTHFAHTLASYSSALQWVKGRHSVKVGGEQRVFLNNFWQPNYPTGIFNFSRDVTTQQPGQGLGDGTNGPAQGNPFATILTGFAHDGQYNIVPAVADKSKETAFYAQDDWKVSPKLTLNLGLRYEWSTPYSERFNRLQFSDFTASTGISIPVSPFSGFPEIGNIMGTTVFPTSSHRNSGVDRNNFAPRLGFAYQLTPNTVLRGGAGAFYGMNVATNFQYAGPAFQKSANIYFTKDNYQTQYASLADPFPAGLAGPQGTKYGSMAQWGFSNASDLDTGTARNAEIYQWNIGIQRLLPGQIVIGVDYSANRSTHLPWAGAGGISTRDRNFISSATRAEAVALAPGGDVTGFLNSNVPNPFQCFFVTVSSPGSWCPATPTFSAADVVDSRYLDDTIPLINLLRPFPQFDGNFEGLPKLIATSRYNSLQIRFQKRASHYVSFEGNYTFSRATDSSSAGRNAWIGNLILDNPQVLDNLGAEYGISSNDATHRLTSAFIVDLPIGRGRWIGRNMNRVVDAVAGGWSLYSFLTLQSGQPLAIADSAGLLADGNQRPQVICSQLTTGISYKEAARTGQPYLNQNCFTNPGDNIPGNAPRHFSNLRGDGVRNLDLSLSKEFNIRENAKLQVRAEAFNVANHQRFAFPDVGSGDGSFGGVFSTTGNFRKMQFGARFQF
ncbi:MAG TPA: TonB-dependent receptor [Candidatus Dormibacteraeota bacterium]|nr:TonB-dependent receptor [Candidatus Dormibacteraeota bacterium]